MKMRIKKVRNIQKVICSIWTSKVDKLFLLELYLLEDGYFKKKQFCLFIECAGFPLPWAFLPLPRVGVLSSMWASRRGGFRCCGTQALGHRSSSCDAQT